LSSPTIEIADETSATTKKIGYALGPLLFLMTLFIAPPDAMAPAAWKVCGLAMWMATWWITEAMPLPVTSLLPIIILPVFGIAPLKETIAPYASPIIFLFLGGFIISVAMEKWNLHLRIGLGILKLVGVGPKSVLGGLMVATCFMGMWLSNTATTIMMMPMALSMSLLLSKNAEKNNNLTKAMVFAVAYSGIIGGLATFVGTPTNAILQGFMAKTYNHSFSLADWMMFGLPLALFLLAAAWCVIAWRYGRHAETVSDVQSTVRESYKKLGPMRREEKITLFVFILVASLWVTSKIFKKSLGIDLDDATVAIFGAVLLFLIPSDKSFNRFTLEWKDTHKLPWGILIFFGGSLAVSDVMTNVGVTAWLSGELSLLHGLNIVFVVIIVTLLLIVVSEMMSNVATITAFLPILAAMADAMQINPILILVPATLAASCAFMLPGASAPNAIAFGTGHLKVKDMIKTGLTLNILSSVAIVLFTFTLISYAFGVDLSQMPDWASRK